MALPIFRYPLDKTGTNTDNTVSREQHSLIPKANPNDVRVFAPTYGPFFQESIEIYDRANGSRLIKNTDYKITDLLQDPTLLFAKAIGQFVVIINSTISNEIEVSYQVLGGNYQNDATAIQHVYEAFLNDTRPIDWTNISGKLSTYPPSLHIHLLEDIIGFGPVVAALDNLRSAVLLNNTPMYEAMIDWVNSRLTPWAKLSGKPTTAAELGISDLVTITRRINTLVGSGLQGGGALDQDRSIKLTDTGVVAGIYGTKTKVPVIEVDQQGRVKSASNVDIGVSTFNGLYGTASSTSWVCPAGVTRVRVSAVGAGSNSYGGYNGGSGSGVRQPDGEGNPGGRVMAIVPTVPGTVYPLTVGRAGGYFQGPEASYGLGVYAGPGIASAGGIGGIGVPSGHLGYTDDAMCNARYGRGGAGGQIPSDGGGVPGTGGYITIEW